MEHNPEERTGTSSSNPFLDPASFPSITAFRDRSCYGDKLWRKRIKSVMAQVYGVGRESRIVSLDILEEEDVVYPLGDGSEEGVGG